jgi:CheY-like chemotaxis protein/nitrogen-specific signal transduction histidine kinase
MDRYCSRMGQLVERDRAQVALRVAKENAEKAAEQAQVASRAKTEFLAKMSHEIRTPMNGVLGMTDLLLESGLTDRQSKYVNIAHHSAETLLNVINDILDFSKIEAGKLRLSYTDYDLFDTVGGAVELLAETAQKKGLEIVYGFAPEDPQWVRGDPLRLRQIIFNLVGNGIKFTDAGEVVVRVSAEEIIEDSVVLMFEIADTGIGIAPEIEEQILKPFEQADGTITRRFGGTGLGLPIARQLIDMMGGKFSIESTPGKGSIFRFTAKLGTQETARDRDCGRSWNLPSMKVLIADDNVTCRDMLAHRLSNWGLATDTAADGQQALEMLRNAASCGQPFELALLDLQMPGLSGLEIGQAISTETALAGTRVIIMTTLGHHDHLDVAKDPGNLSFLTKPVRQSELHLLIRMLMGVAGAESLSMGQDPDAAEPGFVDQAPALGAAVLLAEDNPVNQEVTCAYLTALGCRVDVVETGLEVMAALERTSYDVILMDCQMPEMDGFQATMTLRLKEKQRNQERSTPVIAVTANALEGERDRCLEAGMDDYICKPFNKDTLRAALLRCLSREDSANENSSDLDVRIQSAS